MANIKYIVRKHDRFWGVFFKNNLLAVFDTKEKADNFKELSESKPASQKWELVRIEKASFISLVEHLQDGWEPYAVDDKNHYLKREVKGNR